MQYFERALVLAKDAGDTKAEGRTLINLAFIRWRMGEYNAALGLANEGQKIATLCGNHYSQASALRVEAICYQDLGNTTQSLLLLKTARHHLQLCGMSRGTLDCRIRGNEAEAYLQKSEYAQARSIHIEIIQTTPQEQDPELYAFSLVTIGQIDVMIGANAQDVLQNLERANKIFSSFGYYSGPVLYEMIVANLNLREGEILAAKKLFQKCLHWSWARNSEVSLYCLEKMSDVSRWGAAHFHWTSISTVVYLALAWKVKQKLALYKAFCFLGDVLLSNGDELTAESLFMVALEAFTYMDVHRSRADCMLRLGDIAWQCGDMGGAALLWREARPLFECSQQTKDVGKIDHRLAACELAQAAQMTQVAQLNVAIKHPDSSAENTVEMQNVVAISL
jgi:tetratricopeptide (TPR) repeat protein